MCGICFTVKQHLLRRRVSARSDSRRVPCPCPCRATSACGTRGDYANARSADCAASTTRQTSAPTTTTTAAVVLGSGGSSDVQSHALSLCPGTADMRIARIRCRDDRHLVVDDDDEDSATATATSHMQQQQRPQQHSDDDVDTTAPSASLFAKLVANVQARGPDKCGVVTRSLAASSSSSSSSSDDDDDDVSVSRVVCQRTDVQAAAAVLGLRGSTPVQQPYEVMPAALPRPQRRQQQQQHDDKDSEHDKEQACADCHGSCRDDDEDDDEDDGAAAASFLMWNGEIFDGVLCPPPWGSDTVRLAHRLAQVERTCATAAVASLDDTSDDEYSLVSRQRRFLARCVDVMEGELEGPYGFVYYAATLRMAVFGRDPMGRHSLLTHLSAYVAQSSDACVSRAQSQRVCVELLVTSVGVQHAAQACGERALCAVAPHAPAVSSDTPSSAGDAVCCPETKRARVECIADVCAAAVNDDGAAAVVRNATSSSNTHNTQQQQQQQQQERDKEAHKSNDDDEDATMAADAWSPCWAELPVTGLFAVRLQLPLLSTAVLPSTEHASCDAADADNNDSDGNAAAVPVSLPLSGVAADALLHCRWRRQVHCVHPLLRCLVHRESDVCGVVPSCSATDTAVAVTATTTTTAAARAANSAAAAAATAVGAASTTPHSVRASRGFYMQTDETPPPQLPRALVQRVRQYVSTATAAARATATAGGSRPPRQERHGRVGGCEEQSASDVGDSAAVTSNDDDADDAWAQWAAVRYVYALAAAVQRRIDVTRSGAGDSSSAATVHSARRRPLCILFSGGIDCVVLAALAHYLLPAETPIELANVAFGAQPEQAPDRVAALRAMRELLLLPQPWNDDGDDNGGDASTRTTTTMTASGVREREWRLVLIDVRDKLSTQTGRIVDLVSPRHTVMDFDIGTALWYAARGHGRMQVLRHSDVVDTVHDAEDAQEGGARGGATWSRVQQACSNGSNNNGNSNCSSADARHHHSHSSRLLAGFSKHVRVTGVTAPGEQTRQQLRGAVHDSNTAPTNNNSSNSSNKSSEVAGDGDGDEVQRRFGVLIDVLVSEGQHNGGPEQPVLLSTLGKEYGVFLQPHVARYGYKKLGGYLNDAAHAGVIAFARDAPSKAVRLSRPQDRRRAAALPPSRWFCTRHMMDSMQQAQHEQQQQQGEEQRQPQSQSPLSTTRSRHDDGDDDDTTHAALQPPAGTFVEHYRSCAKVMLLGMGADETLGGYTRYRRFFHRHGMRGARRELEADFARLWQRNLGRDDRVTMDSGREPRFPYLDEGVLRTLEYIVAQRRASLLAHGRMTTTTATATTTTRGNDDDGDAQMCLLQRSIEPVLSFRLSPGEGDKRVLRNVAAMLGLGTITRLQKRAIQFGSRIAERRVKGSASL